MNVLIIEVEGKSGLAACFHRPPLTYEETELRPGLRARTLTPDDALVEYLHDHGLKRIGRRLSNSGALDVVSTAVPGMKDILVLGKVKQLERAGVADLIVLDAPAAGHAVQFLMSARGLQDAVKVGPVQKQASDVVELLTDPTRCQVMLVTLPEETPVNELVDTAFAIEDRAGVALGPIVVNGCLPDVDGLSADTRARAASTRCAPTPSRAGIDARRLARRKRSRRPLRSASTRDASSAGTAGAPRDAAAAPPDRAAVPVHRRRRTGRGRHARRRVRRGCRGDGSRSRDDVRRSHRHRARRWCAAAPAASGRRRPRRRSRSKAHAGVATRWSSPSIRPSDSRTRSGSSTSRTLRARSPGRSGATTATPRCTVDSTRSCSTRSRRSTSSSRSTPKTRSRRSASSRTASTATSPARSRARRSTWRWRSSTSCTRRARSSSSSSTRHPRATRSTSSTRRAGSPACSTTGSSGC